MHVPVCVCSNVRQFQSAVSIIQSSSELSCSLLGRILSATTSGLHGGVGGGGDLIRLNMVD